MGGSFGAADAVQVAQTLRRQTRQRRLWLLIGADADLAARIGADGVHLPERLMALAPRLRRAHPGWLISAAAHSTVAIRRGERFGLDALLISPVFPSRSPSASTSMGPVRLAALIRGAQAPVIGLGGVNACNAGRLIGAGASGLAAIDGFSRG